MSLYRGVTAYPFERRDYTDLMIAAAEKFLEKEGVCTRGETVVMVAGIPPNRQASTNLLKVHMIGERDRGVQSQRDARHAHPKGGSIGKLGSAPHGPDHPNPGCKRRRRRAAGVDRPLVHRPGWRDVRIRAIRSTRAPSFLPNSRRGCSNRIRSIDHVYVMSNVLSIKRVGEWDDASVASASDIVTSFFLFYGAQPPADDQTAG